MAALTTFDKSVCPIFSSCSEVLADLKSAIDTFKRSKVAAVRPLLLAAEENLHNMAVDLDKAVTKVSVFYKEIKSTPVGFVQNPNMLIKSG